MKTLTTGMCASLDALKQIQGGLIVSCQALEGEPLYGADHMAAMAKAAESGGAVAIRANSPEDIRAIKAVCQIPVIGLHKQDYPDFEVYITPTLKEVQGIVDAGADIIAVDATGRNRPDGLTVEELFRQIRKITDNPILADVSTLEEGKLAERFGADLVSTTMSGYVSYSPQSEEPDFGLIQALRKSINIPVLAEGRIWTPSQALRCLELGAYAVVVGTAITRPMEITKRFAEALQLGRQQPSEIGGESSA